MSKSNPIYHNRINVVELLVRFINASSVWNDLTRPTHGIISEQPVGQFKIDSVEIIWIGKNVLTGTDGQVFGIIEFQIFHLLMERIQSLSHILKMVMDDALINDYQFGKTGSLFIENHQHILVGTIKIEFKISQQMYLKKANLSQPSN